jgi:hypothetical protein
MAQYQRKVRIGLRWFYKFNFHSATYRSRCIYLTKIEAKKAERMKLEELDEKQRNPSKIEDFGF